MQKSLYCFYCLLGFLAIYGLTFYGVIVSPFALHDDFAIWMYDPRKNYFGHPQHYFLSIMGRPLAAHLVSFFAYLIHDIRDASYLRLGSVILCALSATGLVFWLRWHKVDGGLAFLASGGVFLAPGLQTAIIWSMSVTLIIAVFISILAGLLLLLIKRSPDVYNVFASKFNVYLIFLAIALLVAGLYIYQPSAMIFMVFPGARILVSSREISMDTWRRLQIDIVVFVSSCVIYFLSHRYLLLPYYYARFPFAEEQMVKHRGYQFKLTSIWLAHKKISLLFDHVIPDALDFISYDFNHDVKTVFFVAMVIIAGVATVFVKELRKTKSAFENRARFVTCYAGGMAMVILLFLFGNAPALLSRGNLANARIYVANSAFVFLVFFWAVFHMVRFLAAQWQVGLSRIAGALILVVLCLSARHNTLRSAHLFVTEVEYLESQIVPHMGDKPSFHVIRPQWLPQELYTPSSYSWWNVPPMVRSIYVKHGAEAKFSDSNITQGTRAEPFEKASDLVVVDMNRMAESFGSRPANSDLVSLERKDHMGFDVIKIVNYSSPYNYFAVTAGEYDIQKKSCPQAGCSRVYAGPTLESVLEWIQYNGGDFSIASSTGVNGPFSPARMMVDLSPVWYTPSPPRYPEWIQFDFQFPSAVTEVAMQSQLPLLPGRDVLDRMPRDFIIQGSHDGAEWVDLRKVTGAQFSHGGEWKEWDFENNMPYRHFRLYITANNGHPDLLAVNRLRLRMTGKTSLNLSQ